MKVFISWSGERSRKVAELLDLWIQCVIQAVDPWVSSQDIDRGALWFSEIANQLSTTTHGIICLTKENKEKPWILFEAGALAKGLSSSRVFTFLIDLYPQDIKDPLAQFNHTFPNKESLFKLLLTVNNSLQEKKLKEQILKKSFDTYWLQFEEEFLKILNETNDVEPEQPRPQQDILLEVLGSIRTMDKRLRNIESQNIGLSSESSNGVSKAMKYIIQNSELNARISDLLSAGVSHYEIVETLQKDYSVLDVVRNLKYIIDGNNRKFDKN